MKIADMKLWGNVFYGAGAVEAPLDSLYNPGWCVFLMGGQEPNSMNAISQIFAQDDLSYLYRECLGIVPSVVSPYKDGAEISLKGAARVFPKGLSTYTPTLSYCMPDEISGGDTNMDIRILGAGGSPTAGGHLNQTITFTYDSPQNFVGFRSMSGTNALPTTIMFDDVTVPTANFTWDAARAIWTMAQCIQARTITLVNGRSRGYIPLSCDVSTGDEWGSVTWAVLAPMSLFGFQNVVNHEIPWITGTVGNDPTEAEYPYYLNDTRRNGSLTLFCDSFYLGDL